MASLNCLDCGTELEVQVEDDIPTIGQKVECESCGLIHRFDTKVEILEGKLINNSTVSLTYDYTKRDTSIAVK